MNVSAVARTAGRWQRRAAPWVLLATRMTPRLAASAVGAWCTWRWWQHTTGGGFWATVGVEAGAALLVVAVPAAPRRWWRYVRSGAPPPFRLAHGGRVRLYIDDPGPRTNLVILHIRAAAPDPHIDDVTRLLTRAPAPVFDDRTEDSASTLKERLSKVGACIRTETDTQPRPT